MIRIVVLAILLFSTFPLQAEDYSQELELSAAQLFRQADTHQVRFSPEREAIELHRGMLVEVDGKAAGYSYQPNEEILGEGISIFQSLKVEFPRDGIFPEKPKFPARAFLLVGHTGKSLQATINGKEVSLPAHTFAGNYWKKFEIPPTLLVNGDNEIGLTGEGKIWIAREDERNNWPNDKVKRKQQSVKKVKLSGVLTATSGLGPKNDIAGEYYVRLYLDGYLDSGMFHTHEFDAADLTDDAIPPPNVRVRSIHVRAENFGPRNSLNSGITWANRERTEWYGRSEVKGEYTLKADDEKEPLPRYFSPDFYLPSNDPAVSPQLKSVRVRTEIAADKGWGENLKILARQNPNIFYPSDSFNFESFKHPRLAELRKQYALDEVVKGCTTDLQRMEKLAVWTSQQWTKGHLGKIYPKWDALEILKKHEDGTPIGGFCQQYNLVFLQACESFGMVGRCVSIGSGDHGVKIRSGHEVVEIWSNELNKWVYVDGQAAWYFVDKETRTPLNLLELRERQLAAILDKSASKEAKREVDVVVLAKSPYEWKGLQDWPAFTELRMIPHTAFLDGIVPVPLNQGMRGWFWTGHRVWTDDLYPASVLYSDRVSNVHDWNWPINQTRIWLQQNVKMGTLDVRLNHNMPSFAKFVVQINEEAEKDVSKDEFTWPLHPGENQLQVQAVNVHGIRGPVSWIKVEYKP